MYEPVDVKFRMFIPAPVVAFPQGGDIPDKLIPEVLYGLLGGDGRTFDPTGGTHRCQVTFRLNPDPSVATPFSVPPEIKWGQTRVFKPEDGQHSQGRPNWWWQLKKPDAKAKFETKHEDDDTSVKVTAQLITNPAMWRVRFEIHAGIPLQDWKGALAPIIDASSELASAMPRWTGTTMIRSGTPSVTGTSTRTLMPL